MARNTVVQRFRETATEEQWKELVKNSLATTPVGSDIPEKYGFSWSAIVNDAIARGYYEKRRNKATLASTDNTILKRKEFTVHDSIVEAEVISRSVQINKDLMERLHTLEQSKKKYTKRAVLNQLLSDALDMYGY